MKISKRFLSVLLILLLAAAPLAGCSLFAVDEIAQFRSFLKQGNNSGNLGWDADDPSTWAGVEFGGKDDKRIVSISLGGGLYITGTLDLSGFSLLQSVKAAGGQLTAVKLAGCAALTSLDVSRNKLIELDISDCIALENLYCGGNPISSLDISKNSALKMLNCIDTAIMDTAAITGLTENTYVSLNEIDQFKRFLYQTHPSDGLTNAERLGWDAEYPLSWHGPERAKGVRFDISGIHITEITIWVDFLNDYTGVYSAIDEAVTGTLDLSGFPLLESVRVSGSKITAVNLAGCAALTSLDVSGDRLIKMDTSGCISLEYLSVSGTRLSSLDLSTNPALKQLNCKGTQLSSLDVSKNPKLKSLDCGRNLFTSLDLSQNTALNYLDCHGNSLTSLNVSNTPALNYLDCHGNSLTSLDVSNHPMLWQLHCNDNELTSLDVSDCPELTYLGCSDNPKLGTTDIKGLTENTRVY